MRDTNTFLFFIFTSKETDKFKVSNALGKKTFNEIWPHKNTNQDHASNDDIQLSQSNFPGEATRDEASATDVWPIVGAVIGVGICIIVVIIIAVW